MSGKKWIFIYFLVCFFILIFVSPLYILLMNSNENSSYSDIVSEQIAKKAIYGTALNQNNFSYKLELIKQTKPEIIALGSSRVMQFRSIFFEQSFISAGGGMNNLEEGFLFVNEMIKFHKPKKVILGLDFWWFSKEREGIVDFKYHSNTGDVITKKKLFFPIKLFNDNKFTYKELLSIMLGDDSNDITYYKNLGYQAIKSSNGFLQDGSYLYGKELFLSQSEDKLFENTLNRIELGLNGFEHNQTLSFESLKKLDDITNLFKNNNIEYIVIIPPLSQYINRRIDLNKDKYEYKYNFIKKLEKIGVINYENIFNNDCEFIDGFHGGDVIYAKITQELYNKGLLTASSDHKSKLDKLIYENKSRASIKSNFFKLQEIDFLNLDCKKN